MGHTREVIEFSKGMKEQLLKEHKERLATGIALKKAKAQQEQDLKDKGWANSVIGEEIPRALRQVFEEPEPIEEKVIEAKKELIKKVVDAEVKQEIAIEAADQAADLIEKAVLSIDDIQDNHQEWIEAYEDETGRKWKWKGVITQGFKDWLDANGIK